MKWGEASTLSNLGRAIASLLAAFGIGWIALQLQQQASLPRFLFPLIFPLIVGGGAGFVVGIACAPTMRVHKGLLMMVAIQASIVLVLTQTWFSYRYYVAEINRQLQHKSIVIAAQNSPETFAAASFTRFIQTQLQRSGGWLIVDAMLTIAACVLVALWLTSNHVTTPVIKQSDLELKA